MSLLTPLSEKAKELVSKFDEAVDAQRKKGGPQHPMTSHKPLASLANQYGICIASDVWCAHRYFSFQGITVKEQDFAYELLTRELQLYHPQTFQKMRLDTIILCSSLTQNGTASGGMSCMGTKLGNAVLINIGSIARCLDNWPALTVHHELFHAIDYGDDLWSYDDPSWGILNPKEFAYIGYKPELAGKGKCDDPGFVSHYSKAAVCEDKAELYTYLVNDYEWVVDRLVDDPIIEAKVKRLKQILRKFSPQFDDAFWKSIQKR